MGTFIATSVTIIAILISMTVSAGLYLIPSIVAWWRHVPNFGSILVVNICLGWSVIGWIWALAMAFGDARRNDTNITVMQQATAPAPGYGPVQADWRAAQYRHSLPAPGRDPYADQNAPDLFVPAAPYAQYR